MRYRDLGTLEGPVLLFGGPYSNVQALTALWEEAEARRIPAARMICTGDVVAYCGAPARTVAQIRQLGCPVVAGNCEIQLGQGALDCGCGFEEGSACDLLSIGWFSHASAALPAADKAWMATLPDVLTFTHHGSRYAVIHGGVTDVARFIWPVSEDAAFFRGMGGGGAVGRAGRSRHCGPFRHPLSEGPATGTVDQCRGDRNAAARRPRDHLLCAA